MLKEIVSTDCALLGEQVICITNNGHHDPWLAQQKQKLVNNADSVSRGCQLTVEWHRGMETKHKLRQRLLLSPSR